MSSLAPCTEVSGAESRPPSPSSSTDGSSDCESPPEAGLPEDSMLSSSSSLVRFCRLRDPSSWRRIKSSVVRARLLPLDNIVGDEGRRCWRGWMKNGEKELIDVFSIARTPVQSSDHGAEVSTSDPHHELRLAAMVRVVHWLWWGRSSSSPRPWRKQPCGHIQFYSLRP